MQYKEKLDKIIYKLKEERKLTRKGHKTKVTFDDTSFTRVRIDEIVKILLILQDDEKVLKIADAFEPIETADPYDHQKNDNYEGAETIIVELGENFDTWYSDYLLKQKSQPSNLDWLNILKLIDVCSDIEEQLQIAGKDTIIIPSFPYPYNGRFIELFPVDTVGTRKNYQKHRWEAVQYLKKEDVVSEAKFHNDDFVGYGDIVVKINLVKFDDFYKLLKSEFELRKNSQTEEKPSQHTTTKTIENEAKWSEDFRWEGKKFVFGKYGKIGFTSKDRVHIFKVLTEKKGNWATISELKGNKDADYLRSTIGQIEKLLPKEVKKHISIPSTTDDDFGNKPSEGAYRIRYIPKP